VNVVITGGSKGIGRAVALRLAAEGRTIVINYHSDTAAADDTVAEVTKRGGRALAVREDVGSPAGCQRLMEYVAQHVDAVDLLVHGAATAVSGAALELDPRRFAEAVEVNGSSLLYLTQAALPLLRRGSSIVFLTSRGSQAAVPNYVALGAPKALAEALVRYLAVELAPRGIRINAVSAGALDTEAFRRMFPQEAEQRLAAAAKANPSGRGLTFDDVTGVIEFLASPDASMIQGQRIHIDGGLSLR
jgi:NAD(P)-dependent dehydrogenase (short-subunit alcohol dehydrogenase family)